MSMGRGFAWICKKVCGVPVAGAITVRPPLQTGSMEAVGGFTADRAGRPGAGGLASVSGNDGVGRFGDAVSARGAINVRPPLQTGSMEAVGGFTADRAGRSAAGGLASGSGNDGVGR